MLPPTPKTLTNTTASTPCNANVLLAQQTVCRYPSNYANLVCLHVACLVCVQLLSSGVISQSPSTPVVTEADLKQVDIQEGYQVDLAPASALQCVVSFAPGQERRVYFAGAYVV
eukprot:GHUV01035528.1.p1 GENE.GHUV01035528.1~~GHUV01035528.1.p1  ORF type:complete len:114 (-),score=19.71 GHUV01035528.1:263-604(-)